MLDAARRRLAKKVITQEELDHQISKLFEKDAQEFFEKKKIALLESLPQVFTPLIKETRSAIESKESVQFEENWRYYFYIPEGNEKVYDPSYGYQKKHYQYGYLESRDILHNAWASRKLDKKIKMGITVDLVGYDNTKHEEMFVSFDYDETSGHVSFVAGQFCGFHNGDWDGREKTFNEFAEDLTVVIDKRLYAYYFHGDPRQLPKSGRPSI